MLKWALIITFLVSLTPIHADANMKKENFAKVKSGALANLDKRIKHLQETKSCVSSSSDRKALKECRKSARKRGEALRSEFKESRKERKEKMIRMRKERKAQKQKK
jgi:hypothetical protein